MANSVLRDGLEDKETTYRWLEEDFYSREEFDKILGQSGEVLKSCSEKWWRWLLTSVEQSDWWLFCNGRWDSSRSKKNEWDRFQRNTACFLSAFFTSVWLSQPEHNSANGHCKRCGAATSWQGTFDLSNHTESFSFGTQSVSSPSVHWVDSGARNGAQRTSFFRWLGRFWKFVEANTESLPQNTHSVCWLCQFVWSCSESPSSREALLSRKYSELHDLDESERTKAFLRGQPSQLRTILEMWMDYIRAPSSFPITSQSHIPVASYLGDRGRLWSLHLMHFPESPKGWVGHPSVWNKRLEEACSQGMRVSFEVLEHFHESSRLGLFAWAYRDLPEWKDGKSMGGTSHQGSLAVGLRCLKEKAEYDPNCLILTALSSSTSGELDPLNPGVLEHKLDAAIRDQNLFQITFAIIAQEQEFPKDCPSVEDDGTGRLFWRGEEGRVIELIRCGTVKEAFREASARRGTLRRYMQWLENLPDRSLPSYFKGGIERKLTTDAELLYLRPHVQLESREGVLPGEEWETFWEQNKRKQIFLVGATGTGKSVVAQMTARFLARRALTLLGTHEETEMLFPLWVRLQDLALTGSVEKALHAAFSRSDLEGLGPNYEQTVIERGRTPERRKRCCLILDGLDALTRSQLGTVKKALEPWIASDCKLLITSRVVDDGLRQMTEFPMEVVHLLPLEGGEATRVFLNGWFSEDKTTNRDLLANLLENNHEVEKTPLLLTLACSAAEHRQLPAEFTRSKLYDWILQDFLRGLWKPKSTNAPPESEDALPVDPSRREGKREDVSDARLFQSIRTLQRISWELLREIPSRHSHPYDSWFEAQKRNGESDSTTARLIADWCTLGLLIPRPTDSSLRGEWGFTHSSFLDYLAAGHVARTSKEGNDWIDGILPLLRQAPHNLLDFLHFLGAELATEEVEKLAKELVLSISDDWDPWPRLLQRFLHGHGEERLSEPLRRLFKVTRSPSSNFHPDSLLTECYSELCQGEGACLDWADYFASQARERKRFWSRPQYSGQRTSSEKRVLLHDSPVCQVAVWGRFVLSLSKAGVFAIWDSESGGISVRPRGRRVTLGEEGSDAPFTAFTLVRETGHILLADRTGRVEILPSAVWTSVFSTSRDWDPETREGFGSRPEDPVRTLYPRERGVAITAVLAWSDEAIAGYQDGEVRLFRWNSNSSEQPRSSNPPQKLGELNGVVQHLLSTTKEREFLSVHSEGGITLWRVEEKPLSVPICRVGIDLTSPIFLPDPEPSLLFGDRKGSVSRLKTATESPALPDLLDQYPSPIDGLLVCGNQCRVFRRDGERSTISLERTPTSGFLDSMRTRWFLPKNEHMGCGNEHMVCGNDGGEIELLEWNDDEPQHRVVAEEAVIGVLRVGSSQTYMTASRGGRLEYAGLTPMQKRIPAPVTGVTLAERQVVAVTELGKVYIYQSWGNGVEILTPTPNPLTDVAWCKRQKRLVCTDARGYLHWIELFRVGARWQTVLVERGTPLHSLQVLHECVVVRLPDGRAAAWNFQDPHPCFFLGEHRVQCWNTCEELRLLLVTTDGVVCAYDGAQLEEVHCCRTEDRPTALTGWQGELGSSIVLGYANGEIRCWNMPKSDRVRSPHRASIAFLASTRDVFVSVGVDRLICFWRKGKWEMPSTSILPTPASAVQWITPTRFVVGMRDGQSVCYSILNSEIEKSVPIQPIDT